MSEAVRTGYLTDVTDEQWAFVLPYLQLSREDKKSRVYGLRDVFNAVRYRVKGGNSGV